MAAITEEAKQTLKVGETALIKERSRHHPYYAGERVEVTEVVSIGYLVRGVDRTNIECGVLFSDLMDNDKTPIQLTGDFRNRRKL